MNLRREPKDRIKELRNSWRNQGVELKFASELEPKEKFRILVLEEGSREEYLRTWWSLKNVNVTNEEATVDHTFDDDSWSKKRVRYTSNRKAVEAMTMKGHITIEHEKEGDNTDSGYERTLF